MLFIAVSLSARCFLEKVAQKLHAETLFHWLWLLLSVICSVSVGVLLKIASAPGTAAGKRDSFAFFQMIGWNYLFAAAFCFAVYRPEIALHTLRADSAHVPYGLLVPLAVLLPAVFLVQANSIKHS